MARKDPENQKKSMSICSPATLVGRMMIPRDDIGAKTPICREAKDGWEMMVRLMKDNT